MIEIDVKLKISDEDIKTAIGQIQDFYGVILTEEILQEMCKADLSWCKDWIEAGFDTVVRENTLTVFSRYYLKIMPYRWPKYGDNENYKRMFYEAFVRGCSNKKVKCASLEEYLK